MAVEQIPVTPGLITWARARAGLSVEEAIKAFPKMEAWEAGEAFPTYSQLEQLAEKFKLPIAVFFFPEPPRLPPIEETFRTLPAAQFAEIPGRVKYLLRKAKALQLNLVERRFRALDAVRQATAPRKVRQRAVASSSTRGTSPA